MDLEYGMEGQRTFFGEVEEGLDLSDAANM